MSKISIYIPAMKLKRIDFYCKENKISRSKFFSRVAMAAVNSQRLPKCKICGKPSVGKFEVSFYREDIGMTSQEAYLCEYHRKKNEEENEVNEI